MLRLFTGLPGSKKTASVVNILLNDPLFKDRKIYYFNLKGCTVDHWTEISEVEAQHWYDLPDGCVIFMDEAQKLYRPQKWDKNKPEYYTQLEEHRHKGIDIFLTTQHPMFIDTHVRRLVDEHVHLHNAFGIRAYSYTWPRCKDDPESSFFEADRKAANIPKKTFSFYTSTVVNTNKKRIPRKIYFILFFALLVFSAFGYLYTAFTPDRDSIPSQQSSTDSPRSSSPLNAMQRLHEPNINNSAPVISTDDYVSQFIPRIPSIPWSAPAYDELMKPTVAPIPVCASFERAGHSNKGCQCWTQQFTRLDIPYADCMNIVHRGLFNPAPVNSANYTQNGSLESYSNQPDIF